MARSSEACGRRSLPMSAGIISGTGDELSARNIDHVLIAPGYRGLLFIQFEDIDKVRLCTSTITTGEPNELVGQMPVILAEEHR